MSKTVWVFFEINEILNFFRKHPKLFCLYLSNKISLRGRFVFKTNGRISSFTSYKDHCYSFFTSWVIKQQKCSIFKVLKKHPTSGVRCAPKMSPKNGNYIFSEACTSWLIGICKKNYKKRHFCAILRGCLKKKFLHFPGVLDCLLCGVPYRCRPNRCVGAVTNICSAFFYHLSTQRWPLCFPCCAREASCSCLRSPGQIPGLVR